MSTSDLTMLSSSEMSTSFNELTSAVPINASTSPFDTFNYFIHPHWKQFPLIPDVYHYCVGVYITIVGLTGIIGNSIVIWIFSTTRNLKTPSNMLIINLALSDLVFSAVNGFPLLTISAFNKKWMWGNIACQFYGFIGGLFGMMSIINLSAISIDRYYNIAEPLKAAKNMTRRKAFMMIIVVWIWSLVWSVPPIFGWGAYIPEGFQTSCTFDYLTRETHVTTFIIGMYIGGFVLPLIIIAASYILIWRAIRKHDREMLKMAKKMKVEDIRANQEKSNAEVRIAKIAMMIVFLYLLSWTPYAIVALIGQFGPAEWVTPYVSELPVMFAKAAAMHNPVVYAFSHPRFREALNKRVPWLMCCCDVKPTSSAANSTNVSRTNKRAVSRQTSNDSYYVGGEESDVSSCISHVDDYGRTMEMKQTVSDTSFTRQPRPTNESGMIVRELIQALVNVSASSQGAAPVNVQNNTKITTDPKGTYVVENGKKIDITNYLQQLVASGKLPAVGEAVSSAAPKTDQVDKKAASKPTAENPKVSKEIPAKDAKNEKSVEENKKNDACYTNPSFEKEIEVAPESNTPDDGQV